MRRMVPEEMVGPGARLPERVHVGATEEIGLHVHLLDIELARGDLLVDELMARVEAAGVADHGHEPRLLLHRDNGFGVPETVCERDLDLYVLARRKALQRLRRMHLSRRGQDHGVEARQLQAVGEVGGDVADAIFDGGLFRLVEFAADQRDHLHAVDQLDAVEMFQAEGPGARQGDLDSFTHFHSLSLCEPVGIPWRPRSRENDYEAFSRMRCPTAVFEAGT